MKDNKAQQYYTVTAILLAGIAVYQLLQITGPTMLPDEFGYWANAAQMLGYDWSDVVSLQSYYSFGYSILLLPVLKFITNPVMTYQAAVLLNVVLVYLHAVLLWNIAGRLSSAGKRYRVFFCIMAAFYPSVIFNMQMTWTESLLVFLYALSIWLVIRLEQTGRAGYALGFTGCLVYLYFVHMRALGVLAAGMIVLLQTVIHNRRISRKKLAALLVLAAGCFAAGALWKEWLQNGLYVKTSESLLNANDYMGQIGKIRTLFSISGFYHFIVSCLGKLFYLGLATCGTVYFGVWYVLRHIRKSPVYLYLCLSAAFTFGITALYVTAGGRADTYIYGRYNEFIVPVFVLLGLCEMLENRYIGRITAGIAVIQGGMAYLLVQEMAQAAPGGFQGYFTVGVSYVLHEYMPRIEDYILRPYVAGTVVMLLLSLVLGLFVRRKRAFIRYLALFAGLYLYTGIVAGNKYLYDHSVDTGADMELAEKVAEMLGDGKKAVFLNSYSDIQYVDILQFTLRENSLSVIGETDYQINADKKADFVFTYQSSKMTDLLREHYDKALQTYHFNLYYDGT